jgi:fibronectin type 3 domain-containing protein
VNGSGESADSAEANATTATPTLPLVPTGLAAMPGHNQVLLNWTAASEATSYNVKRATVSSGPYTTIGTPTATTYTDATAINGTTYYYVVSATNSVGESANSTQATAAPTAMFAHWKFNETSGTTAFDSVGTRHGTLVAGAGWVAGKLSNAVGLNGAGNYVSLPAGVVSSLNANFSIAAWVYVNANGTWARLLDFGTGTTAYMFLAPVSGGNTVRYAITTGGGEQQINGQALAAGAWHHVAVTLSGTTGTLYVDGVAVGSNSSMTLKPANLGNTTLNYIGRSQFNDPYLNGRVDDVRIYNQALSAAQVVALANSEGLPTAPSSLAATLGNNQVSLSWTAVASGPTYKVKRATTSGGPYTTIATATAANYTDSTALNGITYYYVVAAANGAGESANSPQVTATPTELLAYLKFNEASGTSAADASGNGKNGTLATGASFTAAGKINNGLLLNGSSGYVSLPTGVVSTLNDFSISTWVYLNANSTWARLFDFGTGTGNYMFLAPVAGSGGIRYAITTSGGLSEQQINGTAALATGGWRHVAVTLSGTTGILYVDGVAVGTNASMTLKPANLGNTGLNYIGRSQYADPYLNGRVDDFRIYRRALSATDVSTLFTSNGGVPAAPTGLAATPGNGQVGLSWNASASATSYKLKRATTSGGPYTTITNVTTTACLDAALSNGTTYYYVVSAANISGEGLNSTQVSAIPSSTVPVDVSMSASSGALTLSWPADHLGWRLQVQTNILATGLSSNWFDVAGSSATNSVILPVDANQGSVFYRLVYP